jgi:cellobiose-specific phosphotransferase system component IIA
MPMQPIKPTPTDPNELFIIQCTVWHPPTPVDPHITNPTGVDAFAQYFALMIQAEDNGNWEKAEVYRGMAEAEALQHIKAISPQDHTKFWFRGGRIQMHFHKMLGAYNSFRASLFYADAADKASYLQISSKFASASMHIGYYMHAITAFEGMLAILNEAPPLTFVRGDAASLRCHALTQLSQACINRGKEYFRDARDTIREAVILLHAWMEPQPLDDPTELTPHLTLSDDGLVLEALTTIPLAAWDNPRIAWPKLYMLVVWGYVNIMRWLYLLAETPELVEEYEPDLLRCEQWLQDCAEAAAQDIDQPAHYQKLPQIDQLIFKQSGRIRILGIEVIDALCERDFAKHHDQVAIAEQLLDAAQACAQIINQEHQYGDMHLLLQIGEFIVRRWQYRSMQRSGNLADAYNNLVDLQEDIQDAIAAIPAHPTLDFIRARHIFLLGSVERDLNDAKNARRHWDEALVIFAQTIPGGHALSIAHIQQLLAAL